MAPSLSIFGDFTKDPSIMYNNFRVYGTGLLIVMGTIVFVGVKFVNKFASVALACVILSIVAVYVGLFYNIYGNESLKYIVAAYTLLSLFAATSLPTAYYSAPLRQLCSPLILILFADCALSVDDW